MKGKKEMKIIDGICVEKRENVYALRLSEALLEDIGTTHYAEFTVKDTLVKGEAFLSLEASKRVLDLLSPVNANILSLHKEIIQNPLLLHSSKPEEAWILTFDYTEEAYAQLQEENTVCSKNCKDSK